MNFPLASSWFIRKQYTRVNLCILQIEHFRSHRLLLKVMNGYQRFKVYHWLVTKFWIPQWGGNAPGYEQCELHLLRLREIKSCPTKPLNLRRYAPYLPK
ncbi:hypothetical protein ALQ67_200038 [Pseudomonas savastanoi pv. glycinea]|nr:hypothetical protein ALQ67_200038 [Pseudomonas savastanoi pv. glycinea]RMN35494.1 hypothetical protein ALQ66_200046 [Pseudomonas savastanoi pv. glycinea]